MKFKWMVLGIFSCQAVLASMPRPTLAEERGNGGDVVACYKNNQLISARLLDFYEAEEIFQEKMDLGKDSLSVRDKVALALSRVGRFDKFRSAKYQLYLKDFFTKGVTRFTDGVLRDIPDSFHIDVPEGCKIEQVAVQIEPEFPREPRLTIANKFWRKLSKDHRAGLILHEIVYREAMERKHKHSRYTRWLTWKIASQRYKNGATIKDHMAMLHISKIGLYRLSKKLILDPDPKWVELYPTNELKQAMLFFSYNNRRYVVKIGKLKLVVTGKIEFYKSGAIKKVMHNSYLRAAEIQFPNNRGFLEPPDQFFAYFQENGSLQRVERKTKYFLGKLHREDIYCERATFHSNGMPATMDLVARYNPVITKNSGKKVLSGPHRVVFDSQGFATSWTKI